LQETDAHCNMKLQLLQTEALQDPESENLIAAPRERPINPLA